MAEEAAHVQEFNVRKLSTQSVTLYPTKAQVTRDINDIALKSGVNEIVILGVTPTADETSIKVDGKGTATITDIAVDLVTNREKYEDVYPDNEDSEDDEEDTDDDSESDAALEDSRIKALEKEQKEIEDEMQTHNARCTAARGKLSMLQQYTKSLEHDRPSDLPQCLQLYEDEGIKADTVIYSCMSLASELSKKRGQILKRIEKVKRELRKEKAKRDKAKVKAAEKKLRERREKVDAKRRLREERMDFWPKKIYRIVVSIDAGWDTPASSRRGSIDSVSVGKSNPPPPPAGTPESCQVSLSLTYITHSAYWTPRYDLSLSSTNGTGTIVYRSEYCNSTSETWKDAKISLSTSEAAFSGIAEAMPTLWPWTIRLQKRSQNNFGNDDALLSSQEQGAKQQRFIPQTNKANEPRHVLFGPSTHNSNLLGGGHQPYHAAPQSFQSMPRSMAKREAGLFGNDFALGSQARSGAGLFGAPVASNNAPAPRGGLFGSSSNANTNTVGFGSALNVAGNTNVFGNASNVATNVAPPEREAVEETFEAYHVPADDSTIVPDLPSLNMEEASWAEEGLTFSYEIPGLRTIVPSFTKRRFRIASIPLKNVQLSYLLVPKLRAAAFLKARIQNSNNASITLLRGLVGITLDNSFLGNTTLPRCSAGESFSLSLGVDPSVTVIYAKPALKRASTGLFQKDETTTYTRSCTIINTKPSRAIEGVLLDQIPVSQDEKLRTSLVRPGGSGVGSSLSEDGPTRSDGKGVGKDGKTESASVDDCKHWGKATVGLKARGEIRWEFKIEPSKGAKFTLEYETKYPSGETLVGN